MSRTSRLFDLLQCLRVRRRPVTAVELAQDLGVSKRTIHRDLDTLRALGAPVDGEAGIGYVLRPGFLLPPLMMTEDELDALALGALWVRQRGDPALAAAASGALAKIASVLPDGLMAPIDTPSLVTALPVTAPQDGADVAGLRYAIRRRRKLSVRYADASGIITDRVLWPIAIAYFDEARILAAWCEERDGFRHFLTDRLSNLVMLDECYPAQRAALVKAWRAEDRMAGLRC